MLYYKEREQIEDLLTLIGAPKSSLELMEVKIVKEVRNRVNRKTNCETANITKTVEAALEQIAAIRLIESKGAWTSFADPDFAQRRQSPPAPYPHVRAGAWEGNWRRMNQ